VYPAAFCTAVLQFPLLFDMICGKLLSTAGWRGGSYQAAPVAAIVIMI